MRAFLASLALLGVAACQTGVSEGQAVPAAAPGTVPVAFAAGPGERAVSTKLGTDVVKAACVDTRPQFAQTPAVLAAMSGFVQNAQTLTYYHETYDLSVKLANGRCSVVMGGLKDADAVVAVRNQAGPLGTVSMGLPNMHDGRLYIGFFVGGR